ncbi:acyl-CoA dehydrogenase family protein [Bradyrhizobium sp. CB1717]|uniref:acyl-CoA dehydrogenase family protein n=1 Tax=Bradyrhizobium sp. CB1717 TaxID=3039154 RepID=UPI0024B27B0D|nr:acyl-CoA dehydrogenase family protein [Bradyrhizobium sp. CB1717]WFU24527.1 acyl-CoA dehydrogenase family protein [Bradyrhizobium sp. CB1717]
MLFTADHDDIRRSLQKFIANEINPHVDEWEKADIFPAHELFKKMGSLGFLGLNKPVGFGGSGLDYSYALMMAEELGAITCGGVPMAIGVQTDMATPALSRFGSDEVRREFLAPSISGDYVACIGVSEPGAGSDVASIKTNARSDGDDYVINGGKMWITNGTQADWICAADIVIGYALRLADSIGLAKDFGPNVAAYWARLQQRDGFKRAVAAEQKAGVEQNVAPRVRA